MLPSNQTTAPVATLWKTNLFRDKNIPHMINSIIWLFLLFPVSLFSHAQGIPSHILQTLPFNITQTINRNLQLKIY